MNGFELEWDHRRNGDVRGRIRLLPIQRVFADWKDVIWFDGTDPFKDVLPFDFFVPGMVNVFDDDALQRQQKALVTQYLSDADEGVQAACLGTFSNLGFLDEKFGALKEAIKSPSEVVRLAALRQLAGVGGSKWSAAHALLRQVSNDKRESPRLRAAADEKLAVSRCSRRGCCV